MLKPYFLLFILLQLIGTESYSQEKNSAAADTSMVEQYCEMMATAKLFSNKVTIDIDFGEARKFWSDNRIKDETGRIKNFNTIIDAMNYIGSQGWTLVSSLLSGNDPYVYHYIFKRRVLKSELSH